MIVEHGNFEPPPDDATLWRYMDFAKLVDLLEQKAIYFPQAKRFADNYEGVLPKVHAGGTTFALKLFEKPAGNVVANVALDAKTAVRLSRESFYVSCWHKNVHQSAAMWRLYLAAEDQGVAVRTTLRRMKSAFAAAPEPVWPVEVKYIDYSTEGFKTLDYVSLVAHKRMSFKHEEEVRLVWWGLHEQFPKLGIGRVPKAQVEAIDWNNVECPAGRPIDVSLRELIEEILVAPSSPPWFHRLVAKVVKKYGLDCPVTPNDFNSAPIS